MKARLQTAMRIATLLLLGVASGPAMAADAYPSRAIRLLVGFPPGGPTDIIGRVIAEDLSKELGQPIVVENRGGAGGVIAAGAVANAKPDGYTLLMAVESAQTRALALNGTLSYDQEKSFTFIRKVAEQHSLVVVNPKLPVNTLAELISYVKAHPGELNAGGTFATSSHIGATLFDMANGTTLAFINYPGGAQPITDTISGTMQVGFFTEATVSSYIKSGMLRALAIAAPERSAAFPDLPTVTEAGSKPFDPSPWFGIVGPADLPPDVVKTLGDAVDRMTKSPVFQERLAKMGAVPIHGSTAENFATSVSKEIVFWNEWVKQVKAPLAR